MRTRVIRTFLTIAFVLLAVALLTVDVYVAQSAPLLWSPLLTITGIFLLLAAILAYLFVRSFSRQTAELKSYAERLLDPLASVEQLPAGDDDLGDLARSLQRMAPRIRELVDNLKLENARREAILVSMIEGVLAVDKDLRVTFCNNAFARAVGARIPVHAGLPLLDLVRDPGLLEIMNGVLTTGERSEHRLTLPAAADHTFEVLARAVRSLSCTTLPSWSGWSACARISSPMFRMSCAHRWPLSAVTPRRCSTARSRTRSTTDALSRSSRRRPRD
jgi:PAS domain-containing protein